MMFGGFYYGSYWLNGAAPQIKLFAFPENILLADRVFLVVVPQRATHLFSDRIALLITPSRSTLQGISNRFTQLFAPKRKR